MLVEHEIEVFVCFDNRFGPNSCLGWVDTPSQTSKTLKNFVTLIFFRERIEG